MDSKDIARFVAKQKTAFLGSIDPNGYPVIRAMLAPRKIDGEYIYFSTNTSSNKVAQYAQDPHACVYVYKRGLVKYQGLCIKGEMQVCTDSATKEEIWRPGDKMFYRGGVTDPDYCVLKFCCHSADYYCDLKTEHIEF